MTYKLMLFWLGLMVLLTPIPLSAQDDPCAGLVQPRLTIGEPARAMQDDGIGLVLREESNTSSPRLDNLPEGKIFTVQDGSSCADGFRWWRIKLIDGREGYLPEGNTRYFTEPLAIGAFIYQAGDNLLNRYFVNSHGEAQPLSAFILNNIAGLGRELWQSFEVEAANAAIADRIANCPDQLSDLVRNAGSVNAISFADDHRNFFPSPEGTQVLVLRDYLIDLPTCDDQLLQFGTTHLFLLNGNGERQVFPYSQHGAPPESQFCESDNVARPEQITVIEDVIWSDNGQLMALQVRYLRDGCAYYHVFVVNAETLSVTHVGEGQAIGWNRNYLYMQRQSQLFRLPPDGMNSALLPIETERVLAWGSDGLLVCLDNCDKVQTVYVRDASTSPEISAPDDFVAAAYVLDNTHLLWHDDNRLFLQALDSDDRQRIDLDGELQTLALTEAGLGAVIQLQDGRYLYLDLQTGNLREITGI